MLGHGQRRRRGDRRRHIHVYAPCRAPAGAGGDPAACIFTTTSLQAELVSIAGIYRTFEARRSPATWLAGRPRSPWPTAA